MRSFERKHNLVIMDGTDKEKVFSIISKIGDVDKKKSYGVKISKLSDNHPTTVVVEYTLKLGKHFKLRRLLDREYPGLCIYDVAV